MAQGRVTKVVYWLGISLAVPAIILYFVAALILGTISALLGNS